MQIEFLSEMAIILGASLGLIFLTKRLRLPTATGVLIAGMAIGPYGLGLVKDLAVVNALAELGVILLLFLIGLELNPREVGPLGAKAALLAACEVSVSFALGFATGVALAWSFMESFVLASILSISSTAIVGKTILDEFKLKLPESQLVVSALIIEDLFVMFLLVLMPAVLAGGGSPTQLLLVALKAAALISIILPLSRFLIPRLIDAVSQYDVEVEEAGFLLALTLGLAMAALSKLFGFSPGIGAFLFGLLLLGKRARFVYEKLYPIKDLFVILFFVSMGMLIDLSFMKFGAFVVPIILVAIVGKFLGCLAAGRLMGLRGARIGLTMIPRGEFSFVIAKASVGSGAVSAVFYPIAGAVVLATSLFGPAARVRRR